MAENKSVVVTDIVPINYKITDCKLNDSNYLEWIRVIKLYLTSLDKSDYLSKPLADQDATWVRDDARLFLQIRNSIDEGIVGFISHCTSVKELMEYLEYLYAGKGNITRVYDVCLPSEFDTARSAILSSSAIPSLANVFPRLSRSVQSQPSMPEATIPSNNALVGCHPRSGNGKNSQGYTSGGIVYHYFHKPSHIKRDCRRWLRERGNPIANAASTIEASSKMITLSADEFAKFSQYQESLKRSSSSVTAVADSGNATTCLLSSSSKWVIDLGAMDHMTGNSSIFSMLSSRPHSSPVTLADGSTSHVLGSGTITSIPSLPLSSDLLTKRVIGKGRESGGLYILDTTRWEPIACSSVVTLVEAHCRLGHPFLPLLKKLCPQFSSLSSLHLFCGFCVEIQTQFGVPVKILRSDNAKEYFSFPFVSYMRVPKQFWADAVSTYCFLINRIPSAVLGGKTPFHTLFPSKPLFHVDPWYRCYFPELGRYLVSIDVAFHVDVPFFPSPPYAVRKGEEDDILMYAVTAYIPSSIPSPVPTPPVLHVYSRRPRPDTLVPAPPPAPLPDSVPTPCPETTSVSSNPVLVDERPIATRKGKRSCSCTYPISSIASYDRLSPASCSFIASLNSISIPKTVRDALSHPGWRNAMIEEMNALDHNGTWELVTMPAGKRPIGCKWVFTVKLTSVRLLISMAAIHDWPLHQLGIKNAFLHGDLHEEVYMEQPPGFVAQGESGKVCRLRRSLYGLKQSPRAWFEKFSQVVENFGMVKGKSDHSMFYKWSKTGIIWLVVYVDDIVITGNDTEGILSLK
ncbi:PREDICTED: uncharacterized protein LOC109179154 [Ipomoea nil]|uniref:uncharacterized protein LOC109179154 n=1 Tax=Ipomoea nil TaxID=35883 RepID=UPI0009011230|nr:PREDICTED: uncharacterized protein LOC109179154 [Ipomoea nil]